MVSLFTANDWAKPHPISDGKITEISPNALLESPIN
jgi:hypothetical protein